MQSPHQADDPWAVRWLRRTITVPGYLAMWLLLVLLYPILLPLALLSDLGHGRRLPRTRFLAFLVWVTSCDVAGLAGSLATWVLAGPLLLHSEERMLRLNRSLQVWWAGSLLRGATAIYGVELEIEGEPETQSGNVLVLPRHASLGDTVLPIALMPQLHWRYVLKRELLVHPCLDIVGQRLPDAFVRRGLGGNAAEIARVAALGRNLGEQGAVLLYPEGTRFTPSRREHIIASLTARGEQKRAEQARGLRHTLPPRLGGVLALLDAAPDADVVLLAHTGLERAARLGDLWHGRVVHGRLRVRVERWERERLPGDAEGRSRWLAERWREIDEWIDRNLEAPQEAS